MTRSSSTLVAAVAILAFGAGAFAQSSGDAVDARRTILLERQARKPFPNPTCTTPAKTADDACIWGKLDRAIALLYLDRGEDDIRSGNALIAEVVRMLPTLPKFGSPDGLRTLSADGFHFTTAQLLYQSYALFGPRGGTRARHLTAETAAGIANVFFDWARTSCPLRDADPGRTWDVYGSENHEAMTNGACWDAADILSQESAYAQRRYADGSTPASGLAAWNRFLTTYIRERGRHGLFVEYGSTYATYTLQNFYAYAEFARDPELKRLARELLDLWWAEWAQEQLGGSFAGGARARSYPNVNVSGRTAADTVDWVYFGIGTSIGSPAPNEMVPLTSDYRPAPAIAVLATSPRGTYVSESRRPGRGETKRTGPTDVFYRFNPTDGGILRYTYVTPRFVMGTAMFARLPSVDWPADSSQNRWNGIMLGTDAANVVYAIPAAAPKTYNGVWGVQDKATQIVAKIPMPLSRGTGPMQMYVASKLAKHESGGWIFASDGTAYVAMRPASGGWHTDPKDPRFADLDDDTSPVILQAGDYDRYPTLQAFQSAVSRMSIRVAANGVSVRGLDGAAEIRFYPGGALPRVGGKPIDTAPDFTFRSPYVNEAWNSGTVHIGRSGAPLALDFGPEAR